MALPPLNLNFADPTTSGLGPNYQASSGAVTPSFVFGGGASPFTVQTTPWKYAAIGFGILGVLLITHRISLGGRR